jgi:TIR domain-containing protein
MATVWRREILQEWVNRNIQRAGLTLVETLAELFEHQGQREAAQILRSAQSRIDYAGSDDWNHGTEYFTLHLELPVAFFARIEPELDKVQETIQLKLARLYGHESSLILNRVIITGVSSVRQAMSRNTRPNSQDFGRLWDPNPNFVRLFLSHVSTHKFAAADLKRELRYLGISAFIAHEDVEPSLDWQSEIEKALSSMDALAALLTPDFHVSKWTDQEVGIALGRSALVIPIKLGILPYGFIARQQALTGDLETLETLASKVVDVIKNSPQHSEKMREAMVVALERAPSYAASRACSLQIAATTNFSLGQLDRIERACTENRQVKDSTGVVWRIEKFLKTVRPERDDDEIPF